MLKLYKYNCCVLVKHHKDVKRNPQYNPCSVKRRLAISKYEENKWNTYTGTDGVSREASGEFQTGVCG